MLVRLYLVLFLSLYSHYCAANEANWNCQQNKTTKEWECVGSTGASGVQTQALPEIQKPSARQLPKTPSATSDYDATAQKQFDEADPKSDSSALAPDTVKETRPDLASETEIPSKPAETVEQVTPPAKPAVRANTTAPLEPELKILPANTKPTAAVKGQNVSVQSTPAAPGQPDGWNCDTKGKDGNWNCQLVGSDPKGKASVVQTEEPGFSLVDPAFDTGEEHVFSILQERFQTNPWANCSVKVGKQKPNPDTKKIRVKADVDMNANFAEVYDNEVGTYIGNVELKRADQRASSNSANYDTVSGALDMHGNVYYSENDLAIYTESANLKTQSDEARLRETLFITPSTPLRGKASAVYRDSEYYSRYQEVAYTACLPGNQDWIVHADELKTNKISGYGSANNAWVEFKGVPIFYSPYLSFPLDNRRMTGFLAPSWGNTQTGGFNISLPFYWNIAPNYDATLRPRYYTKRGVMLAGDFRYMTESSKGSVGAEIMPEDTTVTPDDTERNSTRYLASVKNTSQFTSNISSHADLNLVSDKFYFAELGNALSFPNFSHVRSIADIGYTDEGISLIGKVENYQTIDPNLTGRLRPYRRLPQLNLRLNHIFEEIPASTGIDTEYVFFHHDKNSNPADSVPDGHRFNIEPYVSLPWTNESAFVTPKLSLKYTYFGLDNLPPSSANSISRLLPVASIDSGLFLEKDFEMGGKSMLHTLEPRLFYLFIPKDSQKDIPIFDTSFYDYNFNALFRENRFSGTDRIQDANQITAALTSRLIDQKSGLERLKLSIGDIFYFHDREVTAPLVRIGRRFLESRVETTSFSPFVGELSGQINEHLSFDSGMQWDSERNEIVRGKGVLHFVNDPGEIINLGYMYRKNTLIEDTLDSKTDAQLMDELDTSLASVQAIRNNTAIIRSNDIIQSDVSFRWPIIDNWFAIGRWQYSLLFNQTQEGFFGFEKETCCWRFRVIGRRFVNNITAAANSPINADNPANSQTGIFFQLEFKGLTGIGENLDDFFAQSIYGYRKSE